MFYVKKSQPKKNGRCPVMGRITIDGVAVQFSCKFEVDPRIWDADAGRATGRSEQARDANRQLDRIGASLTEHYREIVNRDGFVTAGKVKNAYLGMDMRCETLLKIFERHNEDYDKMVQSSSRSWRAFYRYQYVRRLLGEFIKQRYNRSDIALNIGVEKVEGDNKGHRYEGLVYSVLDASGNRVGKPLKSSLFGKKYGVEALDRVMEKSAETIKTDGTTVKTKGVVSAALTGVRDGSELPPSRDAFPADGDGRRSVGELFRAALRGKGIDIVLRYNGRGRLYGVTFIDHNSRTVLNGSALGKEFSANALSARFADISTAHRDDLQTPPPPLSVLTEQTSGTSVSTPTATDEAMRPTTAGETPHPVAKSTPDDRSPATRTATPDLSAVGDAAGSLFSILTPDAGGQNDNQSGPKRRKKKKRRYGQQT